MILMHFFFCKMTELTIPDFPENDGWCLQGIGQGSAPNQDGHNKTFPKMAENGKVLHSASGGLKLDNCYHIW